MSVATLPALSRNTTTATPATAQTTPVAPEQRTPENIDFHSTQTLQGPTFDHGQNTTRQRGQQAGNPITGAQENPFKAFMNAITQFLTTFINQLFGTKPPARPCPSGACKPDTDYSMKNNEGLAQLLLDNFDAFKDPKSPGYITRQGLEAMASRALTGDPATDRNIHLAKELLKRPGLVDALDRHSSTGALDGLIDRQKIEMTIKGESPFRYKSDKELAAQMLEHFDDLKGGFWKKTISIDDLKKIAEQKLTGDSSRDHLVWLARELIQRSDTLSKMDNTGSRDHDGLISKKGLKKLSR